MMGWETRVKDCQLFCQSWGYDRLLESTKQSLLSIHPSLHPSVHLSSSIHPPPIHPPAHFFVIVHSEEILSQRVLHADWSLPQHLGIIGGPLRHRCIDSVRELQSPSYQWLQRAFLNKEEETLWFPFIRKT